MTMQVHHLHGCAPAPLALYLKAIGILRLVSEQADPHARGWWQDEHFCLLTTLDKPTLERFFLEDYAPTPFLSPWNKGSGFYKDNDPGLAPLENSTAERFEKFREGVAAARSLLEAISQADAAVKAVEARPKTNKAFQSEEQRELLLASPAYRRTLHSLRNELDKPDMDTAKRNAVEQLIAEVESITNPAEKPPTRAESQKLKALGGYKRLLAEAKREFKTLKAKLLPDCQRSWRGPHARWMAASVVLDAAGEPQFPSLLGTGGNDGRLDFTNNAMSRIGELFDLTSDDGTPQADTPELLLQSLFDENTNRLTTNSIGQFLPGSGGGANSSTGTSGSPSVNPWDFIFMLEGAIAFSARATRRLDHLSATKASAPFAVHSHAAGHASPGDEKDTRGEQWMPLWKQPTTWSDLTALLGDGRMQLRRQSVNRPIDAARAIARLGVARGVTAFTRYSFLERNGQATLAVPLGRVDVAHRAHSSLIDDIAPWMERLQRLARDSHAPARLGHAERRLANAVFDALTHDETPSRWQAVLTAAVEIEALQAGGTAITAGPIPPLQPGWIVAASDGSPEFRLALALGSAAVFHPQDRRPVDPVRHHWLPLERGAMKFQISDKRLAHDSRVVMTGRNPQADCAAIVQRRLIEAGQQGRRQLPLQAAFGCEARLSDLAKLINGEVDLQRVSTLARAFMAIDWKRFDFRRHLPKSQPQPANADTSSDSEPDVAWLAVRLACLPDWNLPSDHPLHIPAEPSLVARLVSGNGSAAVKIAKRRLRSKGLHVPFDSAFIDGDTARLWAAALAFPVSRRTAERAIEILVPQLPGVNR